MQIKNLDCPSCGAPILLDEKKSKARCSYCGKDILLESKTLQDIGEQFSNTFQEAESRTQIEIQKLQLTQELSILKMQLSSLRTEKRGLERNNTKQAIYQHKQIQAEEKTILHRIATVQSALYPSPPNNIEKNDSPVLTGISNRARSTTLLLAFFTGIFGGHRFYTGHIGSAVLQMFTVGGFYIWWIKDIISIFSGDFRDSDGRLLDKEKKINMTVVKAISFFFIAAFISTILKTATGFKGDEPSSPLIMFIAYVLSVLIVNADKLYKFFKKTIDLQSHKE